MKDSINLDFISSLNYVRQRYVNSSEISYENHVYNHRYAVLFFRKILISLWFFLGTSIW